MSKVAVLNCPDYHLQSISQQLLKGIDLLGGWARYINPGDKVFVKLNLLMKKRPEEAVTTHPILVEAVVRQLMELGASVIIGDSPGGPFTERSLKKIYAATGMEEVAQRTGAELNWDISETSLSYHAGKIIKNITLCQAMMKADKIISLSKLKTHQMTKFTGAVKVLFGAVPGLQKAEYHLKMPKAADFSDMLIDLALCINPVLHIMDGIVGMEGNGPSAGTPRQVGKLLVSANPFALDWAALKLVGIKEKSVPTVAQALKRKIYTGPGTADFIGDELIPLNPPFRAPEISGEVRFPVPRFISDFLRPKPLLSPEICLGCGICAEHCPPQAIKIKNKYPDIELEKCIRCFCCQELCPHKAMGVKRNWLGKFLTR